MIDLQHPNYKVPLKNLSQPYDLVKNFKILSMKDYCYAFWVKCGDTRILMNIGMSEGKRTGERVYRKVGNLPGWGSKTLTGFMGQDMKVVVEAVEQKYENLGLKIHKDDVTLHIWDTSKLVFDSYNSSTIEAEKKLFRDCKELFGYIPAGNWQDPNNRKRSIVSRKMFDTLFNEVDVEEEETYET